MAINSVRPELIAKLAQRFSVRERELLCGPSYHAPANAPAPIVEGANLAKNIKKSLSADLAEIFRYGTDDAARDLWKAYAYDKIATGRNDIEPPGPSWRRTKHVYEKHSILNSIRLLFVRVGRFFAYFGKTFLPSFFSFLSLSVGLTLAFDLFIIFKNTFKKPSSFANFFSRKYWREAGIRFKNSVMKDNRPYRLLNDSVWFIVNLTTLVVAGPLYLLLNPLLNTIGFSFDLAHEAFWLGVHTRRAHKIAKKLDAEIKACRQTLLRQDLTPEARAAKEQEMNAFSIMRKAMIKKRNSEFKKRLWIVGCFTILVIGMAMLYFPPTSFPALFLIGSALALVAGSVLTGIGKRTYHFCKEKYGKFKKWLHKKREQKKQGFHSDLKSAKTASTAVCLNKIKAKQLSNHCTVNLTNTTEQSKVTLGEKIRKPFSIAKSSAMRHPIIPKADTSFDGICAPKATFA